MVTARVELVELVATLVLLAEKLVVAGAVVEVVDVMVEDVAQVPDGPHDRLRRALFRSRQERNKSAGR